MPSDESSLVVEVKEWWSDDDIESVGRRQIVAPSAQAKRKEASTWKESP
jgi:hypothetical protein